MAEGSLYDPNLAVLEVKQARGDLTEAIFLVRAYRATLPRLVYSKNKPSYSITSISSPSWNWSTNCAERPKSAPRRRP